MLLFCILGNVNEHEFWRRYEKWKKKSLGSVAYEISKNSFEHLGSHNNCDKKAVFFINNNRLATI